MPERLLGLTLGRYRVDALLGSGGFAWVFAGRDPDLDVDVALKVLKPQYAGDPEFEARFRREASTAARLKHPNIIKIYSVGREEGSVYFAMDLFRQGLSQRLSVMGTLPEPALIKLGLDVASALGFAHRQGVVHRDIKADNILFDEHGNAIVADFGIARAAAGYGSDTGTNMIVGTPQFFSPEQARGRPTDARADIYSLGVTLFLAATGQLPFSGEDWYEIATKHVQEPAPSPRSLNPDISPELDAIILRCLEKDPDRRYTSAEEMYADLESVARMRASDINASTIMVSTPVTGRFQSIAPRKPPLRARALTALAILGSFTLAAVAFAIVEMGVRSSAPEYAVAGQYVRSDGSDPEEGGAVISSGNPPVGSGSSGAAGGPPDPGRGTGTMNSRFVMSVVAPANATILVNGKEAGRGTWSSDSLLAPARYQVSAQLPVKPDCIWGRDSTLVMGEPGRTATVELHPRLCGSMALAVTNDKRPIASTYQVRDSEGELLSSGRVPMTGSVALPVGVHSLAVSAENCAVYLSGDKPLEIAADSVSRRAIPLICR